MSPEPLLLRANSYHEKGTNSGSEDVGTYPLRVAAAALRSLNSLNTSDAGTT